MKRKFLSIACCLIMLMSTIMLISGCGKEKPVAVSKSNAEKAISTAISTIETSNAVKMETSTEVGKTLLIATEDLYYQETEHEGYESWTTKDGEYWYEHFVSTTMMGEHPSIDHNRKLSLEVSENPRLCLVENIQKYPLESFAKASKYKGVLTVTYKFDENENVITLKIVKGKLTSISIDAEEESVSITFEYDQFALEDLVEKPSGTEWFEYQPKIEVSGLKTQYYVYDELDLTGAVINYFEDVNSQTSQEIDLTRDMVTNFSANEAGNFTMTINFLGITLNVDYEVINTPSIG